LHALSVNDTVIPLSFHVTYWNHLHWKDTFSREFSTQRQRNYAAHRGSRRVYTPQMNINGGKDFVGSNRGQLNNALQSVAPIAAISLERDGETLAVSLPVLDGKKNYTLRLFGVQSLESVDISSGENRGRRVTYSAPVTYTQDLGLWQGQSEIKVFKLPDNPALSRYVVIAQEDGFGKILAAGQI